MVKSKLTPQWFRVVIATGLQRLMPLGLPGTPAADTIKLVAVAWADSLWSVKIGWNKEQDAQRLLQAFVITGGRVERWPPPRAVLAVMPPRTPLPRLHTMPIDKRKNQQARETILDLVRSFRRC